MIKKVTLHKIYINNTDKNGNPLTWEHKGEQRPNHLVVIENKSGVRASMFCDDSWHADKLKEAKTWQEGQEVTLEFEKKGEYLNFDIPDKGQRQQEELAERVGVLELEMIKLERRLADVEGQVISFEHPSFEEESTGETPTEDVDPGDIPF